MTSEAELQFHFGVAALGSTCSPWATEADLCAPCAPTYNFDPAILDESLQIASDLLYNLTGRQWPGVCTDTIYPCLSDCWGYASDPHYARSNAFLPRTRRRDIRLPGYPVVSIDLVSIDGKVVDPASYRVEDDRWLVWVGSGAWPACPDIKTDPFFVTYSYGTPPPPGGVRSAATFGCQLSLACAGSDECQLPERVTTITRQGVTLAVLDPLDLLDQGKTGLPSVDAWVASVFTGAKKRRATVWLPGRSRRSRRVTT